MENTPKRPSFIDYYQPDDPEDLKPYIVAHEDDLPNGYEYVMPERRPMEPTPDGRVRFDVLIETYGETIRFVPDGEGGFNVYVFQGLHNVEP